MAAGLLGLRDALEGRPEKEEPAIVVDAPAPTAKGPVEVTLDFDHPERSKVVIRRPPDPPTEAPDSADRLTGSGLAADLPGGLVGAEAEERGVADAADRGPFREADLGDQHGLHEVDLALDGAALERVGEGARVAVQWLEGALDVVEGVRR